jgi:protein gp37
VTPEEWQALSKTARHELIDDAAGDSKFNSQGDNENIEWARWSWNPVTGCRHNCPYCYARDIATTGPTAHAFPNGFAPTFIPSRLKAPHNTPFPSEKAKEWMGHKNVFVCSMADLFGRWVPAEWIKAVLVEVRAAPQWNFLFLTKFPIRMAEFKFPDNAWVGTTVDCQARVANAEKAFRKIEAGVKWLSIEPMLEPLKFTDLGAFQWVVLGGSSRSSQTPEWHPPLRWVVDLREQADKIGVSVYCKTNLIRRPRGYPGFPDLDVVNAPDELIYLPRDKA